MSAQETPALSRVERKRRDTRNRIIAAAERLMTENPVDEITIQHITDAADIGHGTFYLHFKSKNDVLVPIIQKRAQFWDAKVQENIDGIEDPAEILAFASRHMGRVAVEDPLWRWFLQHSGVPVEDMRDAVGRFGARDFGKAFLGGHSGRSWPADSSRPWAVTWPEEGRTLGAVRIGAAFRASELQARGNPDRRWPVD